MFPPARERVPEGEAPWWESEDHLPELPSPQPPVAETSPAATIDITDSLATSTDSVAEPALPDHSTDAEEFDSEKAIDSQSPATSASAPPAKRGGMTARGAFLLMAICCAIGCGIGFLAGGTTSIPSQAGWGLVVGTVIAALLSPPKLGWTVAWLPPLVAATVVALLGQITLLGSTPTLAREIAMIAAGLTTLAPAQVLSVALAIALLLVRRKLRK